VRRKTGCPEEFPILFSFAAMNAEQLPADFCSTFFYYSLYRPEMELSLDKATADLGVYADGHFVSLLCPGEVVEIPEPSGRIAALPGIKTVVFLDELYKASKGMEPFLTISTRLYKLIVDDHQTAAADLDMDQELFEKIKSIYWSILQEDASGQLINEGFRIVTDEAITACVHQLVAEI